jgi:hypothetical protein
MAHAVLFDTLAYANKLKEAGVPDKQAEAQCAALVELFDYQAATKKDMQESEARLKHDLQESEARLKEKIAEMKVDLLKWVIGLLFAQSALLVSFFKIFH